MKAPLVAAAAVAVAVCSPATHATTREGDRLPSFRTVDEHMRPVSSDELLGGAALVLLYGSAT